MKKTISVIILAGISIMFIANFIAMAEDTPPLIRLHILANSNSQEDQRVKYLVRDRVIYTMSEKFKDSQSLEESEHILLENLQNIEDEARAVLREEGSQDGVKAYYGTYNFPTKYYGTFSLQAGRYEALKLVIGEGEGANWWCVLFPPLCFVDGQNSEKAAALAQETQQSVKLKPKLAIVKLCNKITQKITEK